jgi:hypoxanthine-guanine phosphoribosyltransferase
MTETNKIILTNNDVLIKASKVAIQIRKDFAHNGFLDSTRIIKTPLRIYAVPKGGIAAMYAVLLYLGMDYEIVENVHEAQVIIDDIIDSGQTKRKLLAQNSTAAFYSLCDARDNPTAWTVFPWEVSLNNEDTGIMTEILRLSQYFNVSTDEIKERLGLEG